MTTNPQLQAMAVIVLIASWSSYADAFSSNTHHHHGPLLLSGLGGARSSFPPASFPTTPTNLYASSLVDPPTTEESEEAEAAFVAASAAKSWQDDGFVFGLDGSGLERPKGRSSQVVVEGDSLETTPYQVAVVTATMLGHAAFAASSLAAMLAINQGNLLWTAVQAILLTVASYSLADFGSGVLHWSVDNYGNGKTPIMGSIIAAFQGHHSAPWTITERGFCNNVYKLCTPFGLITMTVLNFLTGPYTTFFLTAFCVFEILSQEFHKWSHQLPTETPRIAKWLQAKGIVVGKTPHANHHKAPYDGNYCIISGWCNDALDRAGIFRRLEHLVYKCNGVESNAWKLDPELRARTLRGDYGLASKATS